MPQEYSVYFKTKQRRMARKLAHGPYAAGYETGSWENDEVKIVDSGKFELVENDAAANAALEKGLLCARAFVNKTYLSDLSHYSVIRPDEEEPDDSRMRFFRVERLVYKVDELNLDKLISVYSALYSLEASAVLVIHSGTQAVSFYLGIRSEENASAAGAILESSFNGNFPGSILHQVPGGSLERIIMPDGVPENALSVSSVSVVPSARDQDKTLFVQGMEKFVDSMKGKKYTAVFIGEPVSQEVMERRKNGLMELSSSLSPFTSTQLSYGENYSRTVTEGMSRNFSKSVNRGITDTNSGFHSSSSSWGGGDSFGFFGFTFSSSHSAGFSSGSSWASAVTHGDTEAKGEGSHTDTGETRGDNRTITVTYQDRRVQEVVERIDRHLERIQSCESFGLWDASCYFISNDIQTAVTAASTYKALMAGNDSGVECSAVNIWDAQSREWDENRSAVLASIRRCVHPRFSIPADADDLFLDSQIVTPCSLISGNELPLFMGLPRYSIPGVTVLDTASFGRNVSLPDPADGEEHIRLGRVFHMGSPEETEVSLDLNSFCSHCFITGTTGSGKSNTTYRILDNMIQHSIPFLVIEPAKGEYKRWYGSLPGIHVYCTNPRYYSMLKLNPFRFCPEIHILEHLDRLIEIFNACWPLYAAMPAILKESFERAYVKCGWDLENSIHIPNSRSKYPTFRDVLETLPEIIGSSAYSAESKGNYTGALVTRVKSLTNGISGQVFCSADDIAEESLFDENAIVDLSRVSSLETKSLLMGILILKLSEYRMSVGGENQALRHLTVMEEAHNILKRSPEGGTEGANVQAKSVEMISSAIAEMRTFGEGFLIVDQSPSAVDPSAIRNTNTKIVMRLPDYEDCQSAGLSMGLNENQIHEIARFPRGVAAVFQNNWPEAVLAAIDESRKNYHQDDMVTEPWQLAQTRGQLVSELVCLYEGGESRSQWLDTLMDVVRVSPLNRHKKEDLYRTLAEIFASCEGNAVNKRLAAYLIFSLIDCGGLFEAIPIRFSGDYQSASRITADSISTADRQAVRDWFLCFRDHLDSYALVSDEAMKGKIIRYLLLDRRCREGKVNKYHIIYAAAYGKRGKGI